MHILVSRLGRRYAFVVVAVTFLSLLVSAGLRAAPSVLMTPLQFDFGWSRGLVSAVAADRIWLDCRWAPDWRCGRCIRRGTYSSTNRRL
jgi:hypothetical protein